MHRQGAAWMQAIAIVAIALAIGVALLWRLRLPFDNDTLAIEVAQLRSDAAEAAALAHSVRADQLAPGFVRLHAEQLSIKVQSVDATLRGKSARAPLGDALDHARQSAGALLAALDALSEDGQRPLTQTLPFDALAQRLDALHRQLKPAG